MWIAIQNAVGARQGVGGAPGPPPYTPPMDAYPADVAYSVRLVNTTYSGPCMEVYRVSDGATQDIGFDSFGRVSATELAAFSGGSVLEVQTWYDQMPGANHAVATTNSTTGTLTRAIIYNGSSIITDGGEPALDFVNPVDFPTLRFSNLGVASGYESFQVTNADTTNSGTPLYVTSTGYNFNHHQPISYPNGNVYEGFGSNSRPAFLGIGYPNMYMQHVYNTTAGPTKNVRINNTLVGTASSAANVGSLSHYVSAMARTQVGDDPAGRYKGYVKELFIYKAIQTSGMRDALTSNINNFYQIGNFPDYTSGFLADYPDAAAAYSVRQLSNTAIKCMRVRRAVPPYDEQDIGFTAGGDLDEAAIVAFGGSDVLTVSAWYDQSGQSRHATQVTPGSQPQIYNGTAVITENSKPALKGGTLTAPSIAFNGTTSGYFIVNNQPSGEFVWLGNTVSNNYNLELERFGDIYWRSAVGVQTIATSAVTMGQQNLIYVMCNLSKSDARINASDVTDTAPYPGSSSTISSLYNGRFGATVGNTVFQEIIYYDSDQEKNATGIEINTNLYYGIYTMYNYEPATSGFLFDYPDAAAAYSVRQLNNNATVSMRVRRTVAPFDETNIGFVNGDLDEAAIVAFGGSDALLVSAWYDQSGQQNHAEQVTPGSQPQIYNGTAVIEENGKPAIRTIGQTGHLLFKNIAIDAAGGYTSFAAKGSQTDWGSPVTAGAFIRSTSFIRVYGNNSNLYTIGSSNNFDRYVLTARKDNRDYDIYKGTTNIDSRTLATDYGNSFTQILKGANFDANSVPDNGFLHEVIIYDSAKSDTDVTAIQNNIITEFY